MHYKAKLVCDVLQAPQIRRAMTDVLRRCQAKLGSWVGSSVVHLGDHNVPNALMFIDKVKLEILVKVIPTVNPITF